MPMNSYFYTFSNFIRKLIEQATSINQRTHCEHSAHQSGGEKAQTGRSRYNYCDERRTIHSVMTPEPIEDDVTWKSRKDLQRMPRDALRRPNRNQVFRQARDDLVWSSVANLADSRNQIVQLPSIHCMRFASSGCAHHLLAYRRSLVISGTTVRSTPRDCV